MDQPNPVPTQPPDLRRLSKLAVAAVVLSLFSLILFNVSVSARGSSFNCALRMEWGMLVWPAFVSTFVGSFVLAFAAGAALIVRRRSLHGGMLVVVAVVVLILILFLLGIVRRPHGSPKQAEARGNLKAVYTSAKARTNDRSDGAYPETFEKLGFAPERNALYAYFYRDDVIQPERPGHGPYSTKDFPPALVKYLAECKERSFVAFAIGNIDADSNLDVWAIDDRMNLVNVFDDRCDESGSGPNPCVTHPGK